MLTLDFQLKSKWPKLAWVAVIGLESGRVKVLHGPMVEVRDDWMVEGVWDGCFADGDFDKTDLIFGTGIRKRSKDLIFVSSATGSDRIWHVKQNDKSCISNSLPALLAISGLSLRDDYPLYTPDMESVDVKGLYSYTKKIPSNGPDINVVYFNNILWRDGVFQEIEKPELTPSLPDFKSYEEFLTDVSKKLGKNARASSRTIPVNMLVGLSSGYDSVATAVIARHGGCKKAASITNSASLWRGSDSGKHIADRLEMECQTYLHDQRGYRLETSIWAGCGRASGRNLTLFDYPEPLCLYFSGGYGDTVWDRHCQGLTEPNGDLEEFLCEFRLITGVFITLVPWWGIRKANKIQKINLLDEMKPWTMGTNYDRPIARRLIEEAGIPRGEFAINKKDTSSSSPMRWPTTASAQTDLQRYLSSLGFRPPNNPKANFLLKFSYIMSFIYKNTAKRFGISMWWRPWRKLPGIHLLFVWATHDLRDQFYLENKQ